MTFTRAPLRPAQDAGVMHQDGMGLSWGVILFDDPSLPAGGWACEAGGRPVRIESPHTFGNGAIWLTNVKYGPWNRYLRSHPMLRHEGYLRLSLTAIADEWGVPIQDVPEEACRFLAEVFGDVLRVMHAMAPDLPWRESSAAMELSALYGLSSYPAGPQQETVNAAMANAVQSWSAVPTPRESREAIYVRLTRSRLPHALDMLGDKDPQGPWTFVDDSRMGGSVKGRAAWLLRQDVPFVAQVELVRNHANPGLADPLTEIFAFGLEVQDGVPRRTWVGPHELSVAIRHFDATVKAAWIGQAWGEMPLELPGDIMARVDGPHGALSWSAGLAMENVWHAALRAPPLPPDQRKRADTLKYPRVSPRAMLLRGKERMTLFVIAGALVVKGGFQVVGYGSGQVHVRCPIERINELAALAFSLGLEMPLSATVMARELGQPLPQIDPASWPRELAGPDDIHAIRPLMSAAGERDVLFDLNRLPVLPEEEADRMLSEIS